MSDERDGVAQYGKGPGLDMASSVCYSLPMLLGLSSVVRVCETETVLCNNSNNSSDAIFYPTTCY